jgi:anti-sigma-K factor RskA
MSPDFDELVGSDLEPAERDRLERVHELLISAGPPPDLLAPNVVDLAPRRRRGVLLALAAAIAVTAFAVGAAVVDGSSGRNVAFEEAMAGTAAASNASGSLVVYDLDDAGNWPMELRVAGLPATSGRPYELWLTRGGKLAALCGAFLTSENGSASVPMNAPYRFDEFDGWVVVAQGSKAPLLST